MATPKSMSDRRENLSEMLQALDFATIQFGRATYGPGGRCGPRVQHMYQLVVLLEGSARIRVDADTYHLPVEHVALQRPGHEEHFVFAPDTDTTHTWLMFLPLSCPDLTVRLDALPQLMPVTACLAALVDQGERIGPADDPLADALRVQLTRAALVEVFRLAGVVQGAGPRHPPPVARALAHIEAHYRDIAGLDELCDRACVTRGHLVRLFRRHLDTTPMACLWAVRVRRATELLLHSGLRVGEVAEQCGFQTAAHLSRTVRERHGLSPRDLRARARRGEEGPVRHG
jgi:AraC family transcriptional regulator of arabinose operon